LIQDADGLGWKGPGPEHANIFREFGNLDPNPRPAAKKADDIRKKDRD
jgi:hypothetical protein